MWPSQQNSRLPSTLRAFTIIRRRNALIPLTRATPLTKATAFQSTRIFTHFFSAREPPREGKICAFNKIELNLQPLQVIIIIYRMSRRTRSSSNDTNTWPNTRTMCLVIHPPTPYAALHCSWCARARVPAINCRSHCFLFPSLRWTQMQRIYFWNSQSKHINPWPSRRTQWQRTLHLDLIMRKRLLEISSDSSLFALIRSSGWTIVINKIHFRRADFRLIRYFRNSEQHRWRRRHDNDKARNLPTIACGEHSTHKLLCIEPGIDWTVIRLNDKIRQL